MGGGKGGSQIKSLHTPIKNHPNYLHNIIYISTVYIHFKKLSNIIHKYIWNIFQYHNYSDQDVKKLSERNRAAFFIYLLYIIYVNFAYVQCYYIKSHRPSRSQKSFLRRFCQARRIDYSIYFNIKSTLSFDPSHF